MRQLRVRCELELFPVRNRQDRAAIEPSASSGLLNSPGAELCFELESSKEAKGAAVGLGCLSVPGICSVAMGKA